jgi:ankyrin repeat protein
MSLHEELYLGNILKARRLIRRRININTFEDGETPLMLVAMRPGKEYLTQLLLAAGASVDLQNEFCNTALMLALHPPADNKENVSILLHAGANTKLISCYGYRACDYALRHSSYDNLFPGNIVRRAVLATLETAELADVELMCRTQAIDGHLLQRALLRAVNYEDIARTELLLEMGAQVNCQYFYGRSPLMQAACRAHLVLVKLLLRYGADPAYQDHEGRSALSEMLTCVPGLEMTQVLYGDAYAEEVLGKERLMEIKAAQGEIERLMINKIATI